MRVKFKYFEKLANISSIIAGFKIRPEWLYAQWAHETNDFSSYLCRRHFNLGGLTQLTPNDLPQPDGSCYYMDFDSYEDFAVYFGTYIRLYEEDGIAQATTLLEYCQALKNGGYFGDSVENYVRGCERFV